MPRPSRDSTPSRSSICSTRRRPKLVQSPSKSSKCAKLTEPTIGSCQALPAELWSRAFEFVPYTDLLQLSLVCRTFLVDVLPCLKILEITQSRELHLAPTHRFRGATTLNIICCFLCFSNQNSLPFHCTILCLHVLRTSRNL